MSNNLQQCGIEAAPPAPTAHEGIYAAVCGMDSITRRVELLLLRLRTGAQEEYIPEPTAISPPFEAVFIESGTIMRAKTEAQHLLLMELETLLFGSPYKVGRDNRNTKGE